MVRQLNLSSSDLKALDKKQKSDDMEVKNTGENVRYPRKEKIILGVSFLSIELKKAYETATPWGTPSHAKTPYPPLPLFVSMGGGGLATNTIKMYSFVFSNFVLTHSVRGATEWSPSNIPSQIGQRCQLPSNIAWGYIDETYYVYSIFGLSSLIDSGLQKSSKRDR